MSTLFVPSVFQAVLTPVTEMVTTGCNMCTVDTIFNSPNLKCKGRQVELEARLGKFEGGRFVAGVTLAMFDSIVTKLESFSAWSFKSDDWEKVHEYLYTVDDHVVRTRKVFIQGVPVEHIVKKRLKNVDVVCSGCPPLLFNTVDIRASLSTEQHVILPEGFTVQPEGITHKLQKRFKYKDWWFIVAKTIRQSGKETMSEVFEVELEYSEVFDACGNLDKQKYIALGLMMKLVDFYPGFSTPFMLLPKQ
jgi:hypothetical protein